MRFLLSAAVGLVAVAVAPAVAQQPCWEGPAPSCIAPVNQGQAYRPQNYAPAPAASADAYPQNYQDNSNSPFANDSHAYISSPR